jgi:hypothetical protein
VTVSELIAILEDCDPDASVMIMSQANWPFECEIDGVTVREEFSEADTDECAPNDVFLVEGSQVRYGSRDAWATARTE